MRIVAFNQDFEPSYYFQTDMTEKELNEMHFSLDSDPITYAENIGRQMEFIGTSDDDFLTILSFMGIDVKELDYADVVDDE
jgi:hypothetical protein